MEVVIIEIMWMHSNPIIHNITFLLLRELPKEDMKQYMTYISWRKKALHNLKLKLLFFQLKKILVHRDALTDRAETAIG